MNQLATITSKKQLTIPSFIFRNQRLSVGQKVVVSETAEGILITPADQLVEELAGSLNMPKKWQGKNLDTIISEAKTAYFKKKSS